MHIHHPHISLRSFHPPGHCNCEFSVTPLANSLFSYYSWVSTQDGRVLKLVHWGNVPSPRQFCRLRAAGATLRWGDFSHARKVTKSAPKGERPLGYPPAQLHCVPLFPACVTRGCAGSIDALRASASVCFGYHTPPGRLAGLSPGVQRTVRGAGPQA